MASLPKKGDNLEIELQNNSKFRSYSNDIFSSLQNFDKAKEWADLINCIQKLQKSFSKYPQFPIIPSKLTFCKRMAQCLNPALPGGVHLRALQCFQSAFERIGVERLAADFAIYSMGIFPLFQYAAINVKPILLSIYETHFLPIGESLIPSLSGLIMSLLPGLEEESSEFYDRVLKLLDNICKKTNPTSFYRALWKTIIIASHIRTPAINYLNSRIPSHLDPETISIYLPELQTLVLNSLICGVSDSQLLAQRSCMELIINHFKFEENLIENWEELAIKVLYLLNRKEISLNRRLYQWFLGTSQEAFEKSGKKVIISSLKNLFATPPVTLHKAVDPFKIITSLLDKPELGENIIDNVLPYIFYSLHKFKEGFPHSRELKQSASKFLEILQSSVVWNSALSLWNEKIREPEGEVIGVIDTLVDIQKIDEESQLILLPNILSAMIIGLEIIAEEGNYKKLQSCLQLAKKVFGKLSSAAMKSSDKVSELHNAIKNYQNAYTNLCRKYIFPYFDDNQQKKSEDMEQRVLVIVNATQLLSSLFLLPSGHIKYDDESHITENQIPDWVETLRSCCKLNHPIVSCCGLKTIVDLLTHPNFAISIELQQYIINNSIYTEETILRLWDLLHPSQSSLHFTVSKSLLQLLDYSNKKVCEILGAQLLHKDPIKKVESCRKFSILWTLICDITSSNPLSENIFLMLDCLSDEQPMVKHAGSSWLVSSIPRIERIIDPLFEVLLETSIERQNYTYRTPYDTRRVLYTLNLFKDIMDCDSKLFISNTIDKQVGKKILMLNEIQEEYHCKSTQNYSVLLEPSYYLELLIVTLLRFIQTYTNDNNEQPEFNSANGVVQSTAASLLRYLLVHLTDYHFFLQDICLKLQNPILQTLYVAIEKYDIVLQVQLLRLLQTIVFQKKAERESESLEILSSMSNPSLSKVNAKKPSVWESQIFLPAVRKGLSQPDPSSILPYWLEFLTSTLNYSVDSYAKTIPFLVNCLCDCLNNLQNVYTTEVSKNVMILLKSLKTILSACFDKDEKEILAQTAQQSTASVIEMPGQFFASFVRVFQTDDEVAAPVSPAVAARGEILNNLSTVLRSLLYIWAPSSSNTYLGTIEDNSSNNKYSLQDQVVQIVDYILKGFPNELIYSVCNLWQERNRPEANENDLRKIIMELLNSLDSISPSTVFKSAASLISNIIKRKSREKQNDNVRLIHETTLLDFVNKYIMESRVAPADLSKSWPELVFLLREAMSSRSPAALLLLFRILNNFVVKSTPLDDRRQRREQQEFTMKVIDICLKACDTVPRGMTDDNRDKDRIEALSLKAVQTLSSLVPSMFDKVFDEKDKAVTMMPNLIANIKDRNEKRLPWAFGAVSFLANLQKNGCALAQWKREVITLFYEPNFFYFDFKAISEWRYIISELAKADRTFFSDLMGRVSKSLTSQPSMMFVGKDQENLLRARNIKRIAFVLYTGELDQWSNYLTTIQENLVDALKLSNALAVYEQVFLCLRVMLLRLSHKKLTSFWPVILAEMMRIFGFGGKVAFDPNLVLSACKFLDLALMIPSEQFRLYEWIFIKDYLDDQLMSSATLPYHVAFVEQLSLKSNSDSSLHKLNEPSKISDRQPMILARSVDSLEQLCAFLRNFSKLAYEHSLNGESYSDAIIERVIESDMIEYPNIKDFDGTPEKLIQQKAEQDQLHFESKPHFDTLDKVENSETTVEENELEVTIIIENNDGNNVNSNILESNDNYSSNQNNVISYDITSEINRTTNNNYYNSYDDYD